MASGKVKHYKRFSGKPTNVQSVGWLNNKRDKDGIPIGDKERNGGVIITETIDNGDKITQSIPSKDAKDLARVVETPQGNYVQLKEKSSEFTSDTVPTGQAISIEFFNTSDNRRAAERFIKHWKLGFNVIQQFGENFHHESELSPDDGTLRDMIKFKCENATTVFVTLLTYRDKNLFRQVWEELYAIALRSDSWINNIYLANNPHSANTSASHRIGDILKTIKGRNGKNYTPSGGPLYVGHCKRYNKERIMERKKS